MGGQRSEVDDVGHGRAHLRTIVMAWLVTVPATALIASLVYLAVTAVPLPWLSG